MRLRPFPTLIVRGIASPFVWCLGRLRLAWPEALLRHQTVVAPRSIIAHELAHVRRRDHWLVWLEIAAAIIWWWNPLFWFVLRRARSAAEMACDAVALSTYPDDRCDYAETLLWLSANSKTGAPVFVLGVNTGTPSSFERRMSMIVSQNVSGKLSVWGIVVASCIAILGLPGWLIAQQETPSSDARPAEVTEDRESTSARLDRLEAQIDKLIRLLEQKAEKPASPGKARTGSSGSSDRDPRAVRYLRRTTSAVDPSAADPNSDAARLDRLERAVERLSRRLDAESEDAEPMVDPNANKRSPEGNERVRARAIRSMRHRESGDVSQEELDAARADYERAEAVMRRLQARNRKPAPLRQPDAKPDSNTSKAATVGDLDISVDQADSTIIATTADGQVVWKTDLGDLAVPIGQLVVDGETVLIYPTDGSVRKIDAKTGKVKE